jgi:hypothetical protein
MGMLSTLTEPPAIDGEEPREERPSYDEVMDANETLVRKVALLTTRIRLLEEENAALKRRVEGYQRAR